MSWVQLCFSSVVFASAATSSAVPSDEQQVQQWQHDECHLHTHVQSFLDRGSEGFSSVKFDANSVVMVIGGTEIEQLNKHGRPKIFVHEPSPRAFESLKTKFSEPGFGNIHLSDTALGGMKPQETRNLNPWTFGWSPPSPNAIQAPAAPPPQLSNANSPAAVSLYSTNGPAGGNEVDQRHLAFQHQSVPLEQPPPRRLGGLIEKVGENSMDSIVGLLEVEEQDASVLPPSSTATAWMDSVLTETSSNTVDMLSLNCNGCEYELLQNLMSNHKLQYFDRLQLIWDKSPGLGEDRRQRRCKMEEEMMKTHALRFYSSSGWEGWERIQKDQRSFLGELITSISSWQPLRKRSPN